MGRSSASPNARSDATKEADYPTAAVIECTICRSPYVLRYCLVLRSGHTEEVYGFYPDCNSKRACEREAKRRGVERQKLRTDDAGNVLRIRVASRG